MSREKLHDEFIEPFSIFIVDQTIMENSRNLVDP